MEAKPIEVIMRIDFAASKGPEIIAHAEKVQELIRCGACRYDEVCCRTIRSEGRRPDDFCSMGKKREVEDDS